MEDAQQQHTPWSGCEEEGRSHSSPGPPRPAAPPAPPPPPQPPPARQQQPPTSDQRRMSAPALLFWLLVAAAVPAEVALLGVLARYLQVLPAWLRAGWGVRQQGGSQAPWLLGCRLPG